MAILPMPVLLACWVPLALFGCDSTAPPAPPPPVTTLQVQGTILEGGHVPSPPINLTIRTWSSTVPGHVYTTSLRTDTAGRYTATFGPFPDSHIDSLQLATRQTDCEFEVDTRLLRTDVALETAEPLTLPTLALGYRSRLAQPHGPPTVMCGAIDPGQDLLRLAIWIDQDIDSLRGRWRLNHRASFSDESGTFAGWQDSTGSIILALHPQQLQCSDLQLIVPVTASSSPNFAPGLLTGDPVCPVSASAIVFFEGPGLLTPTPPPPFQRF